MSWGINLSIGTLVSQAGIALASSSLGNSDRYSHTYSPPFPIALDLPVFHSCRLAAKGSQPSNPKHACAEIVLCSRMIKQKCCFARKLTCVERVFHQYENVDVAGGGANLRQIVR